MQQMDVSITFKKGDYTMAHYQVIFEDCVHNTQIMHFDTFAEAQEYWDDYADVETCTAGEMIDLDDGETIWEFGDEM